MTELTETIFIRMAVHDKMPTTVSLSEKFEVSMDCVRRCLGELSELGLATCTYTDLYGAEYWELTDIGLKLARMADKAKL